MTSLRRAAAAAVFLAVSAMTLTGQGQGVGPLGAPPFETYLDLLRQQAGIPGLSAAIVQDNRVVWERGFGFQNLESRVPATPDTPYLVGDLTQTISAVLALQCVEQRRVGLSDSASRFGAQLDETLRLRHVLSHTVPGENGDTYKYDPQRFSQLTAVLETCVPQAYRKTVSHRLLEYLVMRNSVPGTDLVNPEVVPEEMWDPTILERYRRVLERLATPYKVDKKGKATRSELPPLEGMTAAGGLVTTVRDYARFDAALDSESGMLLLEETRQVAWRNVPGKDGLLLPTGLGWFVQTYRGEPVVWHFGLIPNAHSAMVIKLPARHLTLILLANSDGLAAPFQLHQGDVTKSVFASLFLRLFT